MSKLTKLVYNKLVCTSELMIRKMTDGVGAVPLTIEVGTAGVEVNSSPLSLPSSVNKHKMISHVLIFHQNAQHNNQIFYIADSAIDSQPGFQKPLGCFFREGAPRFDDGLTGDSVSFW